jgi:hypothetical protein
MNKIVVGAIAAVTGIIVGAALNQVGNITIIEELKREMLEKNMKSYLAGLNDGLKKNTEKQNA